MYLVSLLLTFFVSFSAFSQEKCEIGQSANSSLAKIFAKNDKANIFLNEYRNWKKTIDLLVCPAPVPAAMGNPMVSKLQRQIASAIMRMPQMKVNRSCIAASLSASPNQNGYLCKSTSDAGVAASISNACYTNDMVDYISWAFNMAVDCMSEGGMTLDPKLLYMKINNESLFHFSVASNSGVGLGQVITPAIGAMNKEASPIIDTMLMSNRPSCKFFKKTLANGARPQASKPYCALVHHSEGLAKNLIYGIGYFKHIMKDMSKSSGVQKAFAAAGVQDSRFHNLAALAMYNNPALGSALAKSAIKKSGKNYAVFEAEMKKGSPYVRAVYAKYSMLKSNTAKHNPEYNDCFR